MARSSRQLRLLLWKNFILQIRRPVGTTFEILVPVLLMAILIVARIGLKNEETVKCFSTFSQFTVEKINPLRGNTMSHKLQLNKFNNATLLAYHPVKSWTTLIMQDVATTLKLKATGDNMNGQQFESESAAAIEASTYFGKYAGAVIFENTDASMPKFVRYKIRLSHQWQAQQNNSKRGTWRTNRLSPFFAQPGPRSLGNPTYDFLFMPLQYAIDKAITKIHTNSLTSHTVNISQPRNANQFPYPSYLQDRFISAVQSLMPLLFTLAFIYTATMIIKELVAEKQYRLKESMKMMGLSNWVHWLAWFLKNFLFLSISCILLAILLKVARIFEFTHWSVILVFLLIYAFSSIFFCFLVSVFFTNAIRSMLFGAVLWFGTYAPYASFASQATFEEMSKSSKAAACLLPNTCLGIAVQIITKFEAAQTGVQWSTFADPPSVDDNFSLAATVLMMFVQAFICWVLTWYIEAVFPGEFGVPRPFYFPFTASYWCGSKVNSNQIHPKDGVELDQVAEQEHNPEVEEAPSNHPVGVDIQNLRKVFKSSKGKKVAVDGLSLQIFKDQITALLGHNGAGKTTTMSMLTGLFTPSSGSAHIGNKSIHTDMDSIRDSLGLCPQHNVLFDRLTVKEHLQFFIALQGLGGQAAKTKINEMLADIQLVDKKDEQSRTLSGGMKRKLCCAIALIGEPNIVFLDEPTSGMDPSARRATWDLLQKHRTNKTIVLTTHFMDEADYLGDRIAIMADGKLRCCGSSLFLKKRYGVGYHMTIVKAPGFQENEVINLITTNIPNAKMVSNIGAELAYVLEDESSKHFKEFFTILEEQQEKLGVSSFGVSLTTLEEVFLKVGEGFDQVIDEANEVQENGPENGPDVSVLVDGEPDSDLVTGAALGLLHFKAMFIKRFLNSLREKKAIISQILLPTLITICGLALAKSTPTQTEDPALVINLAQQGSSKDTFFSYMADFRAVPDSKFLTYAREYYKKVKVTAIDVKSSSINIKNRNQNDSLFVHGKSYSISPDLAECCKYEYLVLNSKCKAALATNSKLCSNVKSFGYTNCSSCLNITGKSFGKSCPVPVYFTPLQDPVTFFTEDLLERSKGRKGFFKSNVAGITIKDDGNKANVVSWFSNQALHTIAAAYSAVNNIILAYRMNDSSYGMQVTNHPLPRNALEKVEVAASNFANLTLIIFLTMAICFIAASFVTFLVAERMSKAKHVQFVSGVGSLSYWTASLAWDFINFLVPAVILVILFAAFQLPGYTGAELGYLTVMLLFYGLSVLPFVYCLSFLFSNPLIAYSVVSLLLMIISLAMVIGVFVCRIPILGYEKEAEIMHHVFLLFPTYAFPQSLMDIAINAEYRKSCQPAPQICEFQGKKWHESALNWEYPGSGKALLYMAIECVVYFILIILFEENFFLGSLFANKNEQASTHDADEDVKLERRRIEQMTDDDYKNEAVVMKNLTKIYSSNNMVAVDHLSIGIPRAECFGLLGVNGAGKTTTFGMLTGEHSITHGTAYLDGFNIQMHLREVQQRIGYCPQFDALVDNLTGREMLEMFARLRGIPVTRINTVVRTAIQQLNLTNWADKMCGNYSGGNKRKLSTALALVGNPPIIFLDEPTSGMDPASRRFLWNTLSGLLNEKRSIVLTSHSMEECEALCTRLVIMVNGQFKCLGSIQHLKSRYGHGFTLLIKLGQSDSPAVDSDNNIKVRSISNFEVPNEVNTTNDQQEGAANVAYDTSPQDSNIGEPTVKFSKSESESASYQRPATASNVQMTDMTIKVKEFVQEHYPGAFLLEDRMRTNKLSAFQITVSARRHSNKFSLILQGINTTKTGASKNEDVVVVANKQRFNGDDDYDYDDACYASKPPANKLILLELPFYKQQEITRLTLKSFARPCLIGFLLKKCHTTYDSLTSLKKESLILIEGKLLSLNTNKGLFDVLDTVETLQKELILNKRKEKTVFTDLSGLTAGIIEEVVTNGRRNGNFGNVNFNDDLSEINQALIKHNFVIDKLLTFIDDLNTPPKSVALVVDESESGQRTLERIIRKYLQQQQNGVSQISTFEVVSEGQSSKSLMSLSNFESTIVIIDVEGKQATKFLTESREVGLSGQKGIFSWMFFKRAKEDIKKICSRPGGNFLLFEYNQTSSGSEFILNTILPCQNNTLKLSKTSTYSYCSRNNSSINQVDVYKLWTGKNENSWVALQVQNPAKMATFYTHEDRNPLWPKLRVAIASSYEPWIMVVDFDKTHQSETQCGLGGRYGYRYANQESNDTIPICAYGLAIDILKELEKQLEFVGLVHVSKDGLYGSYNETTGIATGVIGEIVNDRADLSMDLMEDSTRSKAVQFTTSLAVTDNSLAYMQKDKYNSSVFGPFHAHLWVAALMCTVFYMLFVWLMEKIAPDIRQRERSAEGLDGEKQTETFDLPESMNYVWGIFFSGEIIDRKPKSFGNRVALIALAFFSILIISAYSANLITFFVVLDDTPLVSGIHDEKLIGAGSNLRTGVVKGTAISHFLEFNKNDPRLRELYKRSKACSSFSECVNLLKNGRLDVIFSDTYSLKNQIANDKSCSLKIIPMASSARSIGIVFQKGSTWRQRLNGAVIDMIASGLRALEATAPGCSAEAVDADEDGPGTAGPGITANAGSV
eukprot:gene17576-19328_t